MDVFGYSILTNGDVLAAAFSGEAFVTVAPMVTLVVTNTRRTNAKFGVLSASDGWQTYDETDGS